MRLARSKGRDDTSADGRRTRGAQVEIDASGFCRDIHRNGRGAVRVESAWVVNRGVACPSQNLPEGSSTVPEHRSDRLKSLSGLDAASAGPVGACRNAFLRGVDCPHRGLVCEFGTCHADEVFARLQPEEPVFAKVVGLCVSDLGQSALSVGISIGIGLHGRFGRRIAIRRNDAAAYDAALEHLEICGESLVRSQFHGDARPGWCSLPIFAAEESLAVGGDAIVAGIEARDREVSVRIGVDANSCRRENSAEAILEAGCVRVGGSSAIPCESGCSVQCDFRVL